MNEPTERSIASLRRLARGLVYESHGAEDLVQEAWLAALERRDELREPESWFARVLRNLSVRDRRSAGRRAAREQEAARPEAQPSSAELAGRTEVLRRLLDAVDALQEPYRTAIHLRYLEDLPPRAMARRLGIPVNTARTHVRRGLEQLRRKLDGGPGREREALLAVLAPIVGNGAGLGSGSLAQTVGEGARASTRTFEMPMKLAGALALVTGAASLLAWLVLREERTDASHGESAAPATLPRDVDEPRALPELRAAEGAPSPLAPASSERSALIAAWSVRGCVTRGRTDPFPGAPLVGRVFRGPGLEGPVLFEQRFEADANGEFLWSPPLTELSTVYLSSDAPGHLASPTWDTVKPGDATAQGWRVRVYPLDMEVTGVVRGPGGAPLAGALVHHYWSEDFRTATSAADGRFTLALSSAFGASLRVVAEGYGTRTLETSPGFRGPYDIQLAAERRLPGVVLDEEGQPISGVEITRSFQRPGSIRTDAAGRFVLDGLDSERVTLFLRHPSFRPLATFLEPQSAGSELGYTLTRGVPLSGRILDAAGGPVEGAWVSFDSHYDEPRTETWTDAQGRFALQVDAGEHPLWVWRTGFAQLRTDLVIPATGLPAVELRLQPGHFVAGRVLAADGTPVRFVTVGAEDLPDAPDLIDGFSTATDSSGAFRIDGLTEHGVRLSLSARGHTDFDLDLAATDRGELELRLLAEASFAGLVVDDATGAPLDAFTIRALVDSRQRIGHWEQPVHFESAAGHWRLSSGIDAGLTARFEVCARGYAPLVIGPLVSARPAAPEAGLARLKPGGTVRGRVVDLATGLGLEGVRVRRFSPFGMPRFQESQFGGVVEGLTNADGTFELTDLPLGSTVIHAELAGHAPALDGPFELATTTLERVIELGTGARLGGRLLTTSGAPVASATLDLYGRLCAGEPSFWRAVTDANGAYAFDSLPNGSFELCWTRQEEARSFGALAELVELDSDEVKTLDLQPRGRTTVLGTLSSGFELEATGEVMLSARPTSLWLWPRRYGTLARDGRFRLEHVEPGSYTLSVNMKLADGRAAHGSAELEIPASGELAVTVRIEPYPAR